MSIQDEGSPLGRYAPDDDDAALCQVRLLGLPLRLLLVGREHHDDLMREFRLLSLAGASTDRDAPARLVQLTEILGHKYAAARQRPDRQVDEALDRGEDSIDLEYEVPPGVAVAATRLEELMAEADTFCASQQMMALERPEVIKRFGQWYLGQFVAQIAGADPTPWDGPLSA